MATLFQGARAWLLLLLVGCASGAKAAGEAADPTAPPNSATADVASRACPGQLPPNDNRCLYPVCANGTWSLEPVGAPVVCELSPDLAERQAVAQEAFRGDPGVCYRGECVPRLLCSERCGAGVGDKYGPELATKARACRERAPERDPGECAEELERSERATLYHFGQEVLRCHELCGFPRPSATFVPPEEGQ